MLVEEGTSTNTMLVEEGISTNTMLVEEGISCEVRDQVRENIFSVFEFRAYPSIYDFGLEGSQNFS